VEKEEVQQVVAEVFGRCNDTAAHIDHVRNRMKGEERNPERQEQLGWCIRVIEC